MLYVLGSVGAILGLVVCKNRRIRSLIFDIFLQQDPFNLYNTSGEYSRVGTKE